MLRLAMSSISEQFDQLARNPDMYEELLDLPRSRSIYRDLSIARLCSHTRWSEGRSLSISQWHTYLFRWVLSLSLSRCSIVATPGRLLHLAEEANLNLRLVEYVVFDEADRYVHLHTSTFHLRTYACIYNLIGVCRRLFEMGLADQLKQLIGLLPEHRQTVLFSATLPKMLVEFAAAGLNNPELIRLDTDSKISEVPIPNAIHACSGLVLLE